MKLVRYKKHNKTLYIGTEKNKLSVFFREKRGCLTINGVRRWHFGK